MNNDLNKLYECTYQDKNFTIHYNSDLSGDVIINDFKKKIEISYDELKNIVKIHMNLHGIIENHTINVKGISFNWKDIAKFVSCSEINIEISKLETMDEKDCLIWLFKKLCI